MLPEELTASSTANLATIYAHHKWIQFICAHLIKVDTYLPLNLIFCPENNQSWVGLIHSAPSQLCYNARGTYSKLVY